MIVLGQIKKRDKISRMEERNEYISCRTFKEILWKR